ncbi:alginate export family protein [Hymenobacter cellulosivorans]|uniref:Alginate export family protein n=1 Tax=Hymenobacter cellulosivorans TaxID=2932249 RepID=A0ABY4F894_9BACT|nr:alginate export family protein [Hymenobacter cellulosivorans]UOQ52248.1 alginate export family protein [Hymenobacter cellulosivorans]
MSPRRLPRLGLLLSLLGGTSAGYAQHQQAPPEYRMERAQEDYRYLAADTTTVRPDLFDPVKFIALNPTKTSYLSLGGEVRLQYVRVRHNDWGAGPEDDNGYLLQRYMLHTDWQLGPHVRVFGQLKSGLVAGKAFEPESTEKDQLDLHQAFVDLRTAAGPGQLTLRLGRQEMAYGSSRLISWREAPNVRQTFDGGRLLWHTPALQLDGFVTRPATTKPGVFDDAPNPNVWFWGVYGVKTIRPLGGGLDVYYLGFRNTQARYQQGRAAERRHSVGARWWGAPGSWRYNVEAVYQFGQFGRGAIRAWTASGEFGYAFEALPWRPLLQLRTEYISGDENPESPALQTFNPLFPKGAYFGQAALIGPANLRDIHPVLTLYPTRSNDFTLSIDWDFFWRARRTDGLYSVPYVLSRPGTVAQSAFIGDQLTAELDWQVQRHWELELFMTYFRAGAFLRESGPGQDQTYLSPRVTFRF